MTRSRDTASIIPTVDAKGDLLVGTADNTVDNLSPGTNGQFLTVNSATTTGLEWKTVSATAPVTYNSTTQTLGFDQSTLGGTTNAIINGAFDIWQRGTSGFTTNAAYTADRFQIVLVGETVAVSQQAFAPAALGVTGFGESSFFSRYQVTTSSNAANVALYRTFIEDVRSLAGQTVTFSYYAKADSAKSVSIELTQNFGTGGSSAVNTFVAKQSLTSSWSRYSHTFTIPSISGKTVGTSSFLDLRFFLSAGSNFNARTDSLGQQNITFDSWGWQLEAGTVATPFKRNAPSIQAELAACQRYYQNLVVPSGTTDFNFPVIRETSTQAAATYFLPVTLRTLPALVGSVFGRMVFRDGAFNVAAVAGVTGIAISANGPSLSAITLVITHTTVGATSYAEWDILNATTNLGVSAEL